MNEQQVYVFNQYYIDFLKKLKSLAKEQKDKKPEARSIIKSIRKNYPTMDKLTNEYMTLLETNGFWETNESEAKDFLKQNLYIDISVADILAIISDKHIVYYYICLLDIFRTPELPLTEVLDVIKAPDEFEEKIKAVTNEVVLKKLNMLHEMHIQKTNNIDLKEIENTTLGKLAKEIMEDIDVEALKTSMNDPNMNIFESLQNPNSGFGKVLGNVSKTMLSKLSSGELEKDTLLKDAIDLATKLPNMLPGGMPNGMGNQLGNIGEMLKNLQKMSGGDVKTKGKDEEPDIAEMMMNMMNLNNTQRKRAKSHLEREEKKNKTAKHLKRKLQKRRENNNIQKEVEKANE